MATSGEAPFRVRVDGGMEAARLSAALKRLSAAGAERIELVTTVDPTR